MKVAIKALKIKSKNQFSNDGFKELKESNNLWF
jgi:hypothetical protein